MIQPYLFIDTETLGLGDAPVWEVACLRLDDDVITRYSAFVEHDPGDWFDTLPESFQEDYLSRFVPDRAVDVQTMINMVAFLARDRPLVCGSNPSFDMTRLEKMANSIDVKLNWHYHPEDVPTLARGWLNGKGIYPAPPWKSDIISQMIGVDPREFNRHTALGDCEWSLAMWQKVMGS